MDRPSETIEHGLALYAELIGADEALEEELEHSRSFFFGSSARAEPALDPGAEALRARRHLEWFVLERPSEHLGGVPVEALLEAWQAAASGSVTDAAHPLLRSMASAFLVESAEPERGLLLRDLFGVGEYAVGEQAIAGAMEAGDLVVGRLFPLEDGDHRLSPAAGVIRDAALVEALERDVDELRASRRGVLRIEQRELERMFFASNARASSPAMDAVDARTEARARLREAGVPSERAEELITEVAAIALEGGDGSVVTEALNLLAFETDIDLEPAREAFLLLWGALKTEPSRSAAPRDEAFAGVSASKERPVARRRERDEGAVDRASVRAALASFDEGRAKGRDLEELFGQLERELGLAEVEGEEVGDKAPDFPGVVGAMIAEFRWESDRARSGAREPHGWRHLEAFGESRGAIGLFEELAADDLIAFAGGEALDRGLFASGADATEFVQGAGAFARWCAETQGHPIDADFGAAMPRLQATLPRLVEARAALGPAAAQGGVVYEVAFVGGSRLALRRPPAAPELGPEREAVHELTVREPVVRHLAEGDLVRVSGVGSRARLMGVHPAEVREDALRARGAS